jgi:nucleoid-associated protein YgaU
MGLFGKSLEEKVQDAVEKIRAQFPGASINAQVNDEVVTLTGRAADVQTKSAIMAAFNSAVETDNTVNQISVEQPMSQAAGTAFSGSEARTVSSPGTTSSSSSARTHEVVSGDTLSAMAKRYYGDASKYNRIFEANRDQLTDPDKIKVGQKLKIPE